MSKRTVRKLRHRDDFQLISKRQRKGRIKGDKIAAKLVAALRHELHVLKSGGTVR